MSAREKLHAFVEQLPENQLIGAPRLLESMQAKVDEDPILAILLNAPEDDEPLTEEEQRSLEVSLAAADRGETIPWEKVRKELG
jgi:hypothetical protein